MSPGAGHRLCQYDDLDPGHGITVYMRDGRCVVGLFMALVKATDCWIVQMQISKSKIRGVPTKDIVAIERNKRVK